MTAPCLSRPAEGPRPVHGAVCFVRRRCKRRTAKEDDIAPFMGLRQRDEEAQFLVTRKVLRRLAGEEVNQASTADIETTSRSPWPFDLPADKETAPTERQ